MQLLPTFGNFMPLKKDCVISFDGEYPTAIENVYRCSRIINLNKDKLMKTDAVSWIKIENNPISSDDEESIKALIQSLVEDCVLVGDWLGLKDGAMAKQLKNPYSKEDMSEMINKIADNIKNPKHRQMLCELIGTVQNSVSIG